MPATRSGSVVHQRPQPFPKVSPSGTGAGTGGNGEAAIPENSEADLDKSAPLIPKSSTSTMPRPRTSAAPHPSPRRKTPFVPPPDEEIIEISSDEESSPAQPARMAPSVLAEHRRELSRMRPAMIVLVDIDVDDLLSLAIAGVGADWWSSESERE